MANKATTNKNNVKTVNTKVETEIKNTIDNSVVEENNNLKQQLREMQELLKQLKENAKVQTEVTVAKNSNATAIIEEDEYPEIPTNKPIRVMSLFNGGLNLKTSNDSSALVFRFEKAGDILPIMYIDLSKVISLQRGFFEEGYALIMDKDVIKVHYLEDAVKRLLDHKTMTNILDYDISTIKHLMTNTTKTIQQTIVDLLIEKINKNEYLDRNKVSVVSDIFGHDVYELANKIR